jgi:4-oxalmesaconate hydratase
VYFDTCVYHQPGIDLLLGVVPAANLLFASETVGAVQGIDPRTGHAYDDTRRYVDASPSATPEQKRRIFAGNALGVYPRLRAHPACRDCAAL